MTSSPSSLEKTAKRKSPVFKDTVDVPIIRCIYTYYVLYTYDITCWYVYLYMSNLENSRFMKRISTNWGRSHRLPKKHVQFLKTDIWDDRNCLSFCDVSHTYIHIYIYIYMYVCMHACMHACMHVCMYVCMYVCVCVYIYCAYIYIVHIIIYICIHTLCTYNIHVCSVYNVFHVCNQFPLPSDSSARTALQ